MRNNVLLISVALAGSVVARRESQWRGPVQTSIAELQAKAALGFSPMPTELARPDYNIFDLRAASSIDTNTVCGWWSDGTPYTCADKGNICTLSSSYRGCCQSAACSQATFFTSCLDATASACSAFTSGTMCCTDDASFPYCVTLEWTTSAKPGTIFTMFNCGNQKVASSKYFLSPTDPIASTSASTTSSSSSSAVTTSSSSSSFVTTTSAATSSTTSAAPDNGGGGSSAPAGAIAGGVVGGVAVIALVVLGIFFIMRRKRNNDDAGNAHNAAMAPGTPMPGPGMAQAPPPGNSPPGWTPDYNQGGFQQGYNPHYSYAPTQTSPTTPGYPSPTHSPQPNPGAYDPTKNAAVSTEVPAHGNDHRVSEVPAINPMGHGNNRAELA